ncbi:unnamed protein product, partial [Ixodes pacificus]
ESTRRASSIGNHFRLRWQTYMKFSPMLFESSHSSSSSVTSKINTIVRCFLSRFAPTSFAVLRKMPAQIFEHATNRKFVAVTSKVPRQRPRRPRTPPSSMTSRMAAVLGSSLGSRPPPGTIHRSGALLLDTSRI